MEMKYGRTTEYIFMKAAERLKARKCSLQITNTEIAKLGKYDPKIIGRIMNNRRMRNNKYLIPPAYVEPLVKKLEFNSDTELFWGDIQSDDTYMKPMFVNLLQDLLDQGGDYANLIESVLIDDVSYAKISASIKYIGIEEDKAYFSPVSFVENEERTAFQQLKESQSFAILRLYEQKFPREIFLQFFTERDNTGINKGFRRLEKRLDEFVNKNLRLFLQANKANENSLGFRAYSIIKMDMVNKSELEVSKSYMSPEAMYYHTDDEYDEILTSLVLAGEKYIKQVEKIQSKLDKLRNK